MSWITLKTTSFRWEAELMQQLLAAHQIPARLVDLGIASYFGAGSPTALQVLSEHQQTASLLIEIHGMRETQSQRVLRGKRHERF